MTETIRGIATRVSIAREYLPDIPVDLLTRAPTAVANTIAPHGLLSGAIGYFIAARGDINDQAAIVIEPTANSWTCEQLNTARYRQFPLGLLFRPAHTWVTLFESTRFAFVEPDRPQVDATDIDMVRQRMSAGTPQAITASFGIAPQTRLGDGMDLVHDIADANGAALFRIQLRDDALIVFRAQLSSAPGVDVEAGALGRSDMSALVLGTVIRQRAVSAATYIELAIGGGVIELELGA